jgi:hypothetical protein
VFSYIETFDAIHISKRHKQDIFLIGRECVSRAMNYLGVQNENKSQPFVRFLRPSEVMPSFITHLLPMVKAFYKLLQLSSRMLHLVKLRIHNHGLDRGTQQGQHQHSQ